MPWRIKELRHNSYQQHALKAEAFSCKVSIFNNQHALRMVEFTQHALKAEAFSCKVSIFNNQHALRMVEFTQHALKGQKLLAQGNALGINDIQLTPCKGKSFTYRRGFSHFYIGVF